MTNRATIRQTLLQFLKEDTDVDVSAITDATSLRDGLGLDSVDFVGLVMRIEGQFRIRMSQAELAGLGTVADLLTLVESKLAAQVALAA